MNGIYFKNSAISPIPIERTKNNRAINIDCNALNLIKCEACFFLTYSISKIITPPQPAVRYDIADPSLSNILTEDLVIIYTHRNLHNLQQLGYI